MKGEKYIARLREVTIQDVAKWIGISRRCLRGHMDGAFPINEAHQLAYSAFFALYDAGCLKVEREGLKKVLVRVEAPKEPPAREMRPYIDMTTMRLKLE